MGSRAQTFYDILGVSRSASQAEIRGAYLRLIKQYHPDSTGLGSSEPDFATLINRCYATLKDPEARSRYDAVLDRSPSLKPAHRAQGRSAAMPRPRSPRSAGPVFGALAFVGVIALLMWMPTVQSPVQFAGTMGWPSQASGSEGQEIGTPLPSRSRARQIADLARGSSFSSAERFSRSCFADARRSGNQAEIDSCVLFDLAFLFWRPPANEATSPPYFTARVVSYRHQDTLADLGDRSEARLGRLRERAFTGLIDGLRDPGKSYKSRSFGGDSGRLEVSNLAATTDSLADANVPNWETNQ
jgi:molecular chaperone DnaJ